MKYDVTVPWGGCGSPCGNLHLQRSRAANHAHDPRSLPGVEVSFVDLADCQECPMCGDCEVHGECATDWGHIVWLAQFASPGEPVCDGVGGLHLPRRCALPAGHGGVMHHARTGDGWPVETPSA